MKRITLLLSIFFPTIIFGQPETNQELSKVAEIISGKWLLVKYEHDSLIREWGFEEEKYFVNTFKNNELVKSEVTDGFNVRIMSFKSSGQGSYEDYICQKSESETYDEYGYTEVNEIPELVFRNEKVVIKTISRFGNDDITYIDKLNKEELILTKDIGIKWIYKRIK